MSTIVSQDFYSEKEFVLSVTRFFKEFELGKILQQANFSKPRGCILRDLVQMGFFEILYLEAVYKNLEEWFMLYILQLKFI